MSLHFLSRTAQKLARRLAEAAQAPERQFDPIDHPDIATMDLRAIADLPLAPQRTLAAAARAEPTAAHRVPRSTAA